MGTLVNHGENRTISEIYKANNLEPFFFHPGGADLPYSEKLSDVLLSERNKSIDLQNTTRVKEKLFEIVCFVLG